MLQPVTQSIKFMMTVNLKTVGAFTMFSGILLEYENKRKHTNSKKVLDYLGTYYWTRDIYPIDAASFLK